MLYLRTFALLLIISLHIYSARACINEYSSTLTGELVITRYNGAPPSPRFDKNDKAYLRKKLLETKSKYEKTHSLEDYSDYATMLVFNGKYEQAKRIFQQIEKKSPGKYNTAANLGTTYELLGKNDSALFWIKRAIAINPNSHKGSEWIHVKILEAKIESKGNQDYLINHSILGLDFGDDKIPVHNDTFDLTRLRDQLYYQLTERMTFISPKDPVIAQLLFDLGNVNALTVGVQSGLKTYKAAIKYGYNSPLLDKRKNYLITLDKKAKLNNELVEGVKDHFFPIAAIMLGSGIILTVIPIVAIRRYKRRKTS